MPLATSPKLCSLNLKALMAMKLEFALSMSVTVSMTVKSTEAALGLRDTVQRGEKLMNVKSARTQRSQAREQDSPDLI